MDTITITKKEYNALVFTKRGNIKKLSKQPNSIWDASFGILKKSFGKGDSVNIVRKMRKDWR